VSHSDIIERPNIDFSNRLKDAPAPARVYTLEEIAARNAELNAAHPAIVPTPDVSVAGAQPVAEPVPESAAIQTPDRINDYRDRYWLDELFASRGRQRGGGPSPG
jgi:hypothetical protein